MKKIKGQGTLTALITSSIGRKNKSLFAKKVDSDLKSLANDVLENSISANVVSFSSSRDFYDQMLSILTFLRYVGTPLSWTIYSDGSHEESQIDLVQSAFSFIKIVKVDLYRDDLVIKPCLQPYKKELMHYARNKPLGKKLFYYLNHKIEEPTFFLDSDVLFYKQANVLSDIINEDAVGWFLPDEGWGTLDSNYLKDARKQLYQVNSGFFLLNIEIPNLKAGLDFLKKMNFEYEYFSEQTIFHILFKENNFQPLDPRIFLLNCGDQFDFSYINDIYSIAIRHYTNPVRNKMWQNNWKWHLNIS
jgi:hypothetical protein